jgi:hypothetical protein
LHDLDKEENIETMLQTIQDHLAKCPQFEKDLFHVIETHKQK